MFLTIGTHLPLSSLWGAGGSCDREIHSCDCVPVPFHEAAPDTASPGFPEADAAARCHLLRQRPASERGVQQHARHGARVYQQGGRHAATSLPTSHLPDGPVGRTRCSGLCANALSRLRFQDLYKSAFFFFEGVFYNDHRYPECMDLSKYVSIFGSMGRGGCPLTFYP